MTFENGTTDVSLTTEDDDDVPQLSEHTLAALMEFYTQQKELEEKSSEITEDWQLSQFWYNDETASALAEEVFAVAGSSGSIACVSCPTMYRKLREIDQSERRIVCLEYDKRFQSFGEDFLFYDYNDPLNLPEELRATFKVVICDPPFLSEECLTKTSSTVNFLASHAVILCTGAVMEDMAGKLLNAKACKFIPQHSNQLGNEFKCFTNYEPVVLNKFAKD